MTELKTSLQWNLHCDFSQPQGELYSQFMSGLKDKVFLGTKIGEKNYFPVKQFCSATYQEPEKVLESDGFGVVESFTIYNKIPSRVAFPGADLAVEAPYIVAAISVHNSSQSFLHFLSGVDVENPLGLLKSIKSGLEVRPVWAENRQGNILDILYFEPVSPLN